MNRRDPTERAFIAVVVVCLVGAAACAVLAINGLFLQGGAI